jgi:hypothetical protein
MISTKFARKWKTWAEKTGRLRLPHMNTMDYAVANRKAIPDLGVTIISKSARQWISMLPTDIILTTPILWLT